MLLDRSAFRIHLPWRGGIGLGFNWISADGREQKIPMHAFRRGGFPFIYNWGKLQALAEEYLRTHEPTEILGGGQA